jgi:hypothetical protein
MSSSDNWPFLDIMPAARNLTGKSVSDAQSTNKVIRKHIQTYLSRNLSYDSDALNACLGILYSFEKLPQHIYHFWGVPVEWGFPSASIGLAWHHEEPTVRRKEFPS